MKVSRWPLCALMVAGTFATAAPGTAAPLTPPVPTVDWVQTSDDSVMDSESFDAASEAQAADTTSSTGQFQPVTLDDGFHVFSLRSYGDYTIKLVANAGIESYRSKVQFMANAVNAQNGLSMLVAPGTIAAPADPVHPNVPNGEIWVMISSASPCLQPLNVVNGYLGCGGVRSSAVIDGQTRFSSGAVWLAPGM